MFWKILIAIACLLGMLVATSQAQLTRDAGAASVAGILQKSIDDSDDYEFESRGNQVLFVDLDADIYINREPHDSHDTVASAEAEASGGFTTTHDDEGEEGGCAGGGNGRFLLEVLTFGGNQVCLASKPARPGWDTDPRLACLLPHPGDYLLRVTLVGMGGHQDETVGAGKIYPYLLNVSLRDLAPDLPGMELDKAIKQSVNRLPFKK